jgi:hypothetical protein
LSYRWCLSDILVREGVKAEVSVHGIYSISILRIC